MFIDFREREREREKKNIDVREKHQVVASDRGMNLQPFGVWTMLQLSHTGQET